MAQLPPKILGQKLKATTKVTQMSHQKAGNEGRKLERKQIERISSSRLPQLSEHAINANDIPIVSEEIEKTLIKNLYEFMHSIVISLLCVESAGIMFNFR